MPEQPANGESQAVEKDQETRAPQFPLRVYPQQPNDVGCPSVFCEYVILPLVNKEADSANRQAEQSQVGNPSKDKEKKGGVREMPTAAGKARCEVTSHKPLGRI